MDTVSEWAILWRGIERGLLYAPLAIYVGLLYRHLKRIDVSLDANVILTGVIAGALLKATGSVPLALAAGVAVGMAVPLAVGFLELMMGVDFILAGIVLSLIIHSGCVIWIGESLSLLGVPNLFYGPGSAYVPVLLALCVTVVAKFLTDRFFQTEVGLLARAIRSSSSPNLRCSPNRVLLWTLAVLGSFVGLIGVLNVQYESVARSGGGFGRVIDALASFMLAERVVIGLRGLGERVSRTPFNGREYTKDRADEVQSSRPQVWRRALTRSSLWAGALRVTSIAILGSVVYQTLLFGIQVYAPWPELPRLIVGVFLILLLCKDASWLSLARRIRDFGPPRIRMREAGPAQVHLSKSAPGVRESIAVQDLHKHFYRRSTPIKVLKGLTQTFEGGQTILITGYNGVGKTTLLRILAGELQPSGGSVSYNGSDITSLSRHERGFFFLTQNALDSVGSDLTVAENLAAAQITEPSLFRRGMSRGRLERATAMLEKLDLARVLDGQEASTGHRKLAGALSAGQAQCLVLAMAALFEPCTILADEPTSGLDPINSDRVFRTIQDLSQDRLVVLVSHDVRARRLVDLVHFEMKGGVLFPTAADEPTAT